MTRASEHPVTCHGFSSSQRRPVGGAGAYSKYAGSGRFGRPIGRARLVVVADRGGDRDIYRSRTEERRNRTISFGEERVAIVGDAIVSLGSRHGHGGIFERA